MEDKNSQSKKRFDIKKINFSNALVVLIGFAMLSVIIYAAILRVGGNPNEEIPNQLNPGIEDPRQDLTSGEGYQVYRTGAQFYLEITDGSKVRDVNALLKSLDLPETTEIINPAANYARPIPQDQLEQNTNHIDSDFGNGTDTQPEESTPNPGE